MKVVIMAGGQGTRFWPWSVKERPKQFLPLIAEEETMLQQTYNRFLSWLPSEKIMIATSEEYVPLVKKQLPDINLEQLIIEPFPRDTGPCIALTAMQFLSNCDNEVFASVPADHFIPFDNKLEEIFSLAEKVADIGSAIVTLGIKPSRPETGYGYIVTERNTNAPILSVKEFIEKPDLKKAEELLKEKDVYWNSGIFIWKPSTIKYYMERLQPQLWKTMTEGPKILDNYWLIPKISIDYAILEKADSILTIPVALKWDDVGVWSSLERLKDNTDETGNLTKGNVYSLSTKNCIIQSDDRPTIVIGVEDLIIASTKEGLLVCHKSQEQEIKQVLKKLLEDNN